MKNNIREILDKTNINVLDEINILEYIDELEQTKEEYIKSLDKLDVLDNRIVKAIEYIEENSYKYTQISKDLKEKEINDLLDILRGENNE